MVRADFIQVLAGGHALLGDVLFIKIAAPHPYSLFRLPYSSGNSFQNLFKVFNIIQMNGPGHKTC